MDNKNKLLFLIVGIVLGALAMLIGTYIFDTDTHEGGTHASAMELNHSEEADEHEGETNEHAGEEIVKLTDEEIKELGIIVSVVESQQLQLHSDFTGEIVPDSYKLAHIVPRFGGIVKVVYKEIGDKVQKDEVIAIIESNESLVTYEVKSSISGVVLDLHMTPGELIGDDKHIVTVADLSSVWAELNIYQKDLRKVKVGQHADVYFDVVENAVNAKVFYLSPTVSEETRTATARLRLNNNNGYWKPGMFITAELLTDYVNVEQAVTLNAIQNFEGQKVVFVKEGEGFEPRPVTIGKTNTKYAEILTGLNKGDSYIAQGAFVIKSELLKESFGGGHGH
ncbi:MAG: efflux RND transporter periplasmic adaptor subunit [Bacteroidetes bacterium]|nr:efflux RND transporter periplasmic adaptor subunit [Bacteroidota bacterium]